MSIGEFIKVVGLAVYIFLTFMVSWNYIYLINKYIDSENNKEIDLDKKGKKILIWINSKEYFFRPFMNKPPYVEAKLYKKSYVLG
ncbi:MAG: hypothetical protein IJX16_01430, partial [Clostridia bacterium]|nr:hypothetical protein [Clostridia bacterium]